MLGGVLIVVVLVLVFPVAVFVSGGIASALLGWLLQQEAEARGEPIWRELNR